MEALVMEALGPGVGFRWYAANRRMIDQAASLLGKANFERVFGFSPDLKDAI
jgi:hypothetical protein